MRKNSKEIILSLMLIEVTTLMTAGQVFNCKWKCKKMSCFVQILRIGWLNMCSKERYWSGKTAARLTKIIEK